MAHHENRGRIALDETLQLHYAVESVVQLANLTDTLVIVTSDHSHTMTIGGYPVRYFGQQIESCRQFFFFDSQIICFRDVETIF